MKELSIDFASESQRIFLNDLDRGNLEHAEEVLMKIPDGKTDREKLERELILREGYRKLVQAYKSRLASLISAYKEVGTLEEMKVMKHKLDNYKKLGTLESLYLKLQSLEDYIVKAIRNV